MMRIVHTMLKRYALRSIRGDAGLTLAYHNVVGTTHVHNDLYSVTVGNFRKQMLMLEKYFSVVNPEIFFSDRILNKPKILITFDDGKKNNYNEALPILNEVGFPAIFFITSSFIGSQDYMTADELQKATACGITIGSHGATHPDFGNINLAQTQTELAVSKQRLQELTKCTIPYFAYPYGNSNNIKDADGALLKKTGYTHAFLFGPHNNYRISDPYRVPRLAVTDVIDTTLFGKIINALYRQKDDTQ